jgi:hypothetical protein
LVNTETVVIVGTTSYNGTWVVEQVASGTFVIVRVFVANDATGTFSSRCTGTENIGIGSSTGKSLTLGAGNFLGGYQAGDTITTGTYNICIGYNSDAAADAVDGIAIGTAAKSANYSVGIGYYALWQASGPSNVGIGFQAGDTITSGNGLVIIGYNADAGATSTNCVAIGNSAVISASVSNAIAIGTGATTGTASCAVIGSTGTPIKLGINMTTPTARLHLPAGGTTTGTAQLKLSHTDNNLLATPEEGAVEYDGYHFYGTIGSGAARTQLDNSVFTFAFTDANLDGSKNMTVTHSLGNKYIIAEVYDNNDIKIIPDFTTLVDTNNTTFNFNSFAPLTGTWHVTFR